MYRPRRIISESDVHLANEPLAIVPDSPSEGFGLRSELVSAMALAQDFIFGEACQCLLALAAATETDDRSGRETCNRSLGMRARRTSIK